ncbi:hypothetical protein AMS68_002078 [Peltaster fructicola]|uniref:Acyl-CoA thioesterase II n=1 Tax=Peltaster fructicola TaxID=286661 RepID=A0A6H0XPI3_9PEZI|nr:hypothetical protein AMS68_002078 [Peltaster fructicola]
MSRARATLIAPPPPGEKQAPIESVLELTHLKDIDPNLFTNTRPLWHPPGARGIFGGAVIAQCLSAAQQTVPANFTVHSMHCYFVLNGNADIPVIFHVERIRDGRSFATRTVQARQRGQPIFTTTLSFTREGSGGAVKVEHAHEMPAVPLPTPDDEGDEDILRGGEKSPFMSHRLDLFNDEGTRPELKRARQWVKARGRISDEGGHQAHLSALAYMSDSYFIGTVARVHKLWRYSSKGSKDISKGGVNLEVVKALKAMDDDSLKKIDGIDEQIIDQLRNTEIQGDQIVMKKQRPEIGMMVSLDHTIYFHNPRNFRADEWMLTEMDTPWAGDGRGLVFQRIYSQDGTLIASCVQEGVVRLRQDEPGKAKL